MISLSLHVPGSDSSALTTRYDGLPSDACKRKANLIEFYDETLNQGLTMLANILDIL